VQSFLHSQPKIGKSKLTFSSRRHESFVLSSLSEDSLGTGFVEELHELTKESFFCFRTEGINTCTVECKRKDGRQLGSGGEENQYDTDNDDYNRRAFAFTRAPSNSGSYDGPLLVHVREIPFSLGKLGGSIWYAAVGFSQYISLNPDVVKGKKILELGAGLGLPGIVASHLGAKSVTLSEFGYDGEVDGPIIEKSDEKRLLPSALLDNLKFNVRLNKSEDNSCDIKVRHLDWYDYVDNDKPEDGDYNLIIGSDLVNWEDDVGPLISTLQYFLNCNKEENKAIISLTKANRKALPTFLELIKKEFKTVDVQEQSVVHYEEHPLLLITLTM